ncbi:hypothetical protein MLD38_004316 [Melastoma candidum]|uniref:Uncharacterized protein n=1 Tax=Melastoma candidum TaxID=119954 RepID=A0ACB9S7A0_9MYRT|nr:hypothetical protein MLD38_004316 [Melastoma candidum]
MKITLQLPQPFLPSRPSYSSTSTSSSSSSSPAAAAPATVKVPDNGLRFREKLLYLQSLEIDPHKAVSLNPLLRTTPLPNIRSVEVCLVDDFGLPRSSFPRLFAIYPDLLTAEPSTLLPVRDFLLRDALLPRRHLRNSVLRCPRLLLSDPSLTLGPSLQYLRSLGFRRILSPRSALLLVSDVESTLKPKIGYLQESLGLDFATVGEMAVRSPGLLTLSVEKNLRPKVEYFLGEMGGEVKGVREFPQFFSFSLDGRIRPRFRVLKDSGWEKEVGLGDMLKCSDGEFAARLVDLRLRTVSVEGDGAGSSRMKLDWAGRDGP